MAVVPAATAVAIPVAPSMVATLVAPLVHAPPGTVLANVILLPVHADADAGDMAAGVMATVMVFMAKQPALLV